MSEFSESYHLRSDHAQEAVALLRRAGLKGFVFQPAKGWISFVAENGTFEPNPKIVSGNAGLLVHYASAEDHGWSFTIFEGRKSTCTYRCDWDDSVRADLSQYSRVALERLIALQNATTIAAFEALLRPASFDDVFANQADQKFAEAVGLEHFQWLAYDYVERDPESYASDSGGVIVV